MSNRRSRVRKGSDKDDQEYIDTEYSFFDNICNNFYGYCLQSSPFFNEQLVFKPYDHYEIYDKDKKYHKNKYLAIYNGTPQYYVDYIYCIDSESEKKYYVISKRVPTDIDDLKKYCPCVRCSTRKINPLKYVWCSFCTGCIEAGPWHANPKYIEEARQRKSKDPNPTFSTSKIITTDKVMQCEMFSISFVTIICTFGLFYYNFLI